MKPRRCCQRVFGLCAGYEDLNDFDTLHDDGLFQMVSESDKQLAGKCTLCRMENEQGRQVAVAINTLFVDQFLASKKRAPKEIILDLFCFALLASGVATAPR